MLKPCLRCGDLTPATYCDEHAALGAKPSREARGYDDKWQALSRKARRLQPFCSWCGSTEDLTCDHSPEAWARRERGLPIRLRDVDVLCRSCNARKGQARPLPSARTPKDGRSGLEGRQGRPGGQGLTPTPPPSPRPVDFGSHLGGEAR